MDQIQDDLTCQICQGIFKAPKALPCIHTFCEGCIRDYVFSRGFDSVGHFPCPLCRAETPIPPSGVADFPANYLLQSLIDTLRQNDTLGASVQTGQSSGDYRTHSGNSSDNQIPVRKNGALSNGDAAQRRPNSNTRPRSNEHVAFNNGSSPRVLTPSAPRRPSSPPVLRVSNIGAYAAALDIPVRYDQHRAKVIFGKYGSGLAHFTQPMGLCFTNHYGESLIHITDQRNTRILTFKLDGEIKTIFTTEGTLLDVTSDGLNSLYVTVSNAPNKEALVVSYDLQGTPKNKYGNMFQFVTPDGVAVNKFGDVIVTSVEQKQAFIFNKNGTLVQKFGKKGRGPDSFLTPYHVVCNSYNQIIISDCESHCLKVFDRIGKSKMVIGEKGSGLGQLLNPRGLTVDEENNIIVADAGNQRIQIFDSSGKFQDAFISDLNKKGFPAGCEIYPHSVAVCPGWLAVLFKGRQFAEVRVYEYHSQARGQISTVCACQ